MLVDFFGSITSKPRPIRLLMDNSNRISDSNRICDATANSDKIPIDGKPAAFRSSSTHPHERLKVTSPAYAYDCRRVGGDCRCFLSRRMRIAGRAALYLINTEVARGETSLGLHSERKSIVGDETSGIFRTPNSRSTIQKCSSSIVANNW